MGNTVVILLSSMTSSTMDSDLFIGFILILEISSSLTHYDESSLRTSTKIMTKKKYERS